MKLDVVQIVRDKKLCDKCPCNCNLGNDKYPHITVREDECRNFVVTSDGYFWPANEFFDLTQVTSLEIDPKELA